jgi:N4-gp56 family major capsid protein
MAQNVYTNAASGNPTNRYNVPELLESSNAVEVIGKTGVKKFSIPQNKNEVVSFLRAVTPEPNVNESPEGTTQASRAITFEEATATFEEFDEVFEHSSRQAHLGEIDILKAEKDRIKDLYRRTKEKNAWYTFRACNNVIYPSAAITARNGVNAPLTLGRLRLAATLLDNNRAERPNEMSRGSAFENTTPIEASWVVLCHTDCKPDIRDIPNFVVRARVGGATGDMLPEWFGNVDDFMFVCSPELDPYLASGAAVGTTGMRSAGGTNIDVYTSLVYGKNAFGMGELFGFGGNPGMEMYVLDKPDKSDPTNKRRKCGIRWFDLPIILNQNWCVAIEHAVTANPV